LKKIIFVICFVVAWLPTWVNAQNFELLDTKTAPSGIESLVLGTDGKTIITGHLDGYICFWDIATWTMTKKIRDRSGIVNSILFDNTGSKFVTAGEGASLGVYEYPSGKLLYSLNIPCDHNSFAAFSQDGSYIFYGGRDSDRGYDYNKGTYREPYAALWRVKAAAGSKSEIAFNDEGQFGSSSSITDGNVDNSGKYLVYTRNSELMFYDIDNKRLGYKVFMKGILNNLTPVQDKMYVWGDRYLHLLQLENGRYAVKKTILAGTREGTYGYSKMVLSANGKFLVTGDNGNNVNIWNPNTLDPIQEISGHTDLCRTFVFCKDDSVLVTGGYDGKIMIWGTPPPPKDSIPEIIDVVFTENNVPVSIKERDVELQSTITVSEPEFDIEIWDRSVVDGDSISLNLNGEWILQEYMVVKTKLKLHVKVNPNASNNYLILFAHNLGEISPNTAAVQVLIGDKEYKLTLTSDLKKSGALNFSYAPK
jgi:WD40 repeat protein